MEDGSSARALCVPAAARRVAIIGNAGGGKSTLARRLSNARGLPWREVDRAQYQAGWERTPERELRSVLAEWARGDEWVIDGFGPWDSIVDRFQRAECVVFVDHPLWVHNWLSSQRQVDAALGRGRLGGPDGCDLQSAHRRMFETIARVDLELRPKIIAELEKLADAVVLRIEGLEAMDALLANEESAEIATPCRIRPAVDDDVSALTAMHQRFLDDQASYLPADRRNPAFDGSAYFRRRLGEEHRATFVAASEGETVGFVDGMLFKKGAGSRGGLRRRLGLRRMEEPLELPVSEGYLNNVFVKPSARRGGVAAALIDALADWCAGRGAEALYTDVSEGNGESVRMFEARGFDRVRTGLRRDLSR